MIILFIQKIIMIRNTMEKSIPYKPVGDYGHTTHNYMDHASKIQERMLEHPLPTTMARTSKQTAFVSLRVPDKRLKL